MASTPVVLENVLLENVVVKTKKPSLPAKYSKFLSFGFWFINRLEPDSRDALFAQLNLYSPIDTQSDFFQTYLNEATASNKIMRKLIANHNKPVKTKLPKASRKPSKPVAAETDDLIATLIADANGELPAPKPTKTTKPKKSKKNVESQPLSVSESVSEPVAEPVSESVSEPVAEPVSEPVAEPAKKTRKPKADKTKAEKKTKKTAEPLAEPEPVAEPVAEPEEDADDSIQARIIDVGDSQYLLDSENNVYDINSHEVVGTYNPDSQSVTMN